MAHHQTNGFRNNLAAAGAINNAPLTTPYTNNTNTSNEPAQVPLPPSSPVIRSPRPDIIRTSSSTPRPNPSLRRASSSLSLQSDRRSSSPALMRKSSTSSLRGELPPTPTRLKSRRSSSQLNPHSPLAPAMEEPPLTESSVAEDWFKQELEKHESEDAAVNTVVVVHEACYGHRFARPKTTKSTLSLIVERPERIEASVMGISAAYVRLGERHNGGRYGPDPRERPPQHLPFKIKRTTRNLPINSPAVTQVHGTKWMDELKVMCNSTAEKLASTGRETDRPVDPKEKNKPAFHSGDLYLCPESLAAFEGALGGVCDGVDAVFNGTASGNGPSQAFVCIRPPGHHCSADFPSGFCWLNNVHVGIQHAVKEHQLTHAAIVDFDLHHGDGSQSITFEHNQKVASMPKNTPAFKKTAIGYYSIHDINSYPCENGETDKILNASICLENAHNQSIWNVHLQPWSSEAEFWELYETKYMAVLEKARIFLKHHAARLRSSPNLPKPKGAIFISAGFDASEHEGAGMQRHSVNVPTEFYARFTRDIVTLAQEEGTGVDGRVISVLEGGYSDKALISGVLSHVSGLCHGQHVAAPKVPSSSDGLADEMSRLTVGGLSGIPGAGQLAGIDDVALQLRYNSEWWTSEHLDALVEILNPTPQMPALEAVKTGRTNNFASPTQASKMKVIDPALLQRKSSGHFGRFPASTSPSRPATPPPPTVHWTVAAQELCKLLIPARQTKSHTATDLAAPKVKKERQSSVGLTAVPAAPAGRQLREKRTTVRPSPSIPEQPEQKRVVSKGADRRRTIAANEIAAVATNGAPRVTVERARRRSSIASTVSNMSVAPSVVAPAARPKLTTNGSGSGTGSSMQVKKTRAPAIKPSTTTASRTSNGVSTAATSRSSAATSRSASADLDSLVSKTQKLKINMPSDAEYIARQQVKTNGAPSVASTSSVKPVTTATAKSGLATKKPAEPRKVGRPAKTTISATGAPAASKKPLTAVAPKVKSPTLDLTPDIPGTGAFQIDTSVGASASQASMPQSLDDMTSQYQLESAPTAPVAIPSQQEQQMSSPADISFPAYGNGLPPPTMPTVKQEQPPVWSSTGTIPFAAQQGVQGGVKQEQATEGKGIDIWDVPETPAR